MRLKQKTILAIVGLSVLALGGLVWLQVRLLINTSEQKEEAFRRTVASALAAIATKLETQETFWTSVQWSTAQLNTKKKTTAILGANGAMFSDSIRVEVMQSPKTSVKTRHIEDIQDEMPLRVKGNTLQFRVARPERVRLRVFDVLGRKDSVLVDAIMQPGLYEMLVDSTQFGTNEHTYQYSTDSASVILSVAHGSKGIEVAREVPRRRREEAIRGVFDKLILAERIPIEKRLMSAKLDSVIAASLRDAGIELSYAYGVLAGNKDSLRLVKLPELSNEIKSSEFKTRLFPNDVFAEQNELALFFPDRKLFLLKQMGPMIAATVGFMSIIIFSFAYTVWTVFRQKKMAMQMVDFINNMTHEFKTPISTIALASEAIARPDVLTNIEKVIRYNDVIHDENIRMRHQVEKILQMAVLEEGDYELKLSPVDVHEIILNAVDNIALQIESKQGTIATALEADRHTANVDTVHITNIIHNLLDNASKYSSERPVIKVTSLNENNSLVIRVADNGIGMSAEDAKRAFDKYYRVSTGNQHDVKGFGLGLSYVKLMVEAHKGSVKIESQPGRGTTVEVRLPL
jgi:signal transduction histidine kinase